MTTKKLATKEQAPAAAPAAPQQAAAADAQAAGVMAPAEAKPFKPTDLTQMWGLAAKLSASELIPKPLRGKANDVFVVLLAGHELGLSGMQSLRAIRVIEGVPALSAELMVGLVLQSGLAEYFTLVQSDNTGATYETKRRGAPAPVRMSFTLEDAKVAGLSQKDNWKHYPAALCRARSSSALARAVYADVVAGLAITDEIEDIQRTAAQRDPAPAARLAPGTDRLRAALKVETVAGSGEGCGHHAVEQTMHSPTGLRCVACRAPVPATALGTAADHPGADPTTSISMKDPNECSHKTIEQTPNGDARCMDCHAPMPAAEAGGGDPCPDCGDAPLVSCVTCGATNEK